MTDDDAMGQDTIVIILAAACLLYTSTADYIIDLGPEGGDAGGDIVTTGTPEEVAQCPQSYTGQFLGPILDRDRARTIQALEE